MRILGAVWGYRDGVLDVGGAAAVSGSDGPGVSVDHVAVIAADQEPRLDRDHQARAELASVACLAFVGHRRALDHVSAWFGSGQGADLVGQSEVCLSQPAG